jgi:hypothetical protein
LLDQTSSSHARVRVAPGGLRSVSAAGLLVLALAAALALSLLCLVNPGVASAQTQAVTDLTVTPKAQKSIAYRKTVTLPQWQASKHGRAISFRESHNVCTAVSADGRFRGKWQMSQSLWSAHGGLTFAKTPQRATCKEQDTVARRIWVRSWWWPWGG